MEVTKTCSVLIRSNCPKQADDKKLSSQRGRKVATALFETQVCCLGEGEERGVVGVLCLKILFRALRA